MKKNILLRTNLFVCTIIVLGFIITAVTSYQSNMGIYRKDAEHVSDLASEGIYYQIDSIFSKPVNVSLTMANDSLLREFLSDEPLNLNEDQFLAGMREYLNGYRKEYAYDSVFLVSVQTNRYYHFNGLDRTLTPDNPENTWYYDFLKSDEKYALNIDNDEAAENEVTVFINCKIRDREGQVIGVVGVGFRVDQLQELLGKYEKQFGVQARLADRTGMVEISTQHTGDEKVNLFENGSLQELKGKLFDSEGTRQFWHVSSNGNEYVVSTYIKSLDWFLIVENNTAAVSEKMRAGLIRGILVIFFIVLSVLITITAVMRRYNAKIIELTASREREYYEARQEAAKELYENIYELDITHNCAVGQNTERYFESLGVPSDTPYDEALHMIADKQIKAEFQQGYLETFAPEHVLAEFERGVKSLSYDLMITGDGELYYWVRIMACIYFWSEDSSVRMTTYHQNIDLEKTQEAYLFEQMKRDPLTGLYNKAATEELIRERIAAAQPKDQFAFFIFDIDNFKRVNDTLGHSAGDEVISSFAQNLKKQFGSSSIAGRIGGDEFVVFLQIENREQLEKKARELVPSLRRNLAEDAGLDLISASIGVAVYPEAGTDFETLYKEADDALYQTKRRGKDGYTISV